MEYTWGLHKGVWYFADWSKGYGSDIKASFPASQLLWTKRDHFNAFCNSKGIACLPREAFNEVTL